MPRRGKAKVFVARATGEGTHNNVVGHLYINNHRENKGKLLTIKKYDKRTRTRVEIKLKEEKHS
jgi:hypothetical protein